MLRQKQPKTLKEGLRDKSILDNDLYKFTMQMAVLELFPKAEAEYRFTNRGGLQRFSREFVEELRRVIDEEISGLRLTEEEYRWLGEKCPFLKRCTLNTSKISGSSQKR